MKILPYQLTQTDDLLTANAGLVSLAELLKRIEFSKSIDEYFPQPGSNRGFKPSNFVIPLLMMLHQGYDRLDDLKHFKDDRALCMLLGLSNVPEPCSLGDWLRRMGMDGVVAT